MLAKGEFDVKITPLPADGRAGEAGLGRMSIEKTFRGDIEGTSLGQMLATTNEAAKSGGYVAVEKVSGSLHGRTGTFVLHHTGVMTRGEGQLTIAVVPDSGTGQLEALAGTMRIVIADGRHSYELEYMLE